MNEVTLQGYIRDIDFSHDIGNIEYGKANLICPGTKGREDDIISLRYKKFSNRYKEGDFIELKGNVRSYSQRMNGKNKVDIYVFTYFDIPDHLQKNDVKIDGNICKLGAINTSLGGTKYLQFILANNIFTPSGRKINNYIPCTAYDDNAQKIYDEYKLKDSISIEGELRSRTYKKYMQDGTVEYRIAHEIIINKV